MAEAVGLAVGFIGLAGLFTTCVDCFKLVEVYDSRSCDYEILQTMLDNQQFHFMAWGKACGFMDPDRTNSRFDDSLSGTRNRRIEQTMERIQSLLMNGDNLKEKYGLKVHRAPVGSKAIEKPALSAFSKAFQSTKAFWNTSLQRKSHLSGTIRWAVNDKDKFDKLIQNLRDLLADLTKFTEEIGVPDQQRLIIEYELEMIDDEPSLEAIAAVSACDDDDDIVSGVASRRLSRVKAQSVANQSVRFDDSVSVASLERYTPSTSTLVEEEMEKIVQEVGITRVPLSQWRKVKTRAGIVPWLKVLIVATGSFASLSERRDDIQSISRVNTGSLDLDPFTHQRAVRLAINSQTLISVLRKITAYRFSRNHNVLVYPFKPLLVYEKELRRYLADTQEKLRGLLDAQHKEPSVTTNPNELGTAMESRSDQSIAPEVEKTKRIIEEIECLIHFMDNDMKDLLEIRRQVAEKNLQKIAFEHLWLLFQPGIIAVSLDPNSDLDIRAYQILHVTGGRPIIDVDNHSKSEGLDYLDSWDHDNQEGYAVISSRECTDFVIDCFYMDFDGTAFGPRPQRFVISEFTGERDILSLPVYPHTRTATEDELTKSLLARGKHFIECTEGGRYSYHGPVLKEWDPNHRDTCSFCARNDTQEHLASEIIIDHITAIESCRNSGCSWNPSFGGGVIAKATKADRREAFETVDCSIPNCKACTDVFNDAVIDLNMRDKFIRSSRSLKALHRKQLDNDQLLLLPCRVCGYSLYNRRWYPFNVARLHQTAVPVGSLDDLVLPAGHKSILSALIKAQKPDVPQNDDATFSSDFVRGKGRGTLILLHGAPGVGKTLTAEVLAARLNRPLFLIRIADLGSTSGVIEQNLRQFFKLAERWGCILLIREADIVLARRTNSDREGNNITSVFLDSLEYFSGILILTTSRVGALDETIKSRVHVILYFPRLDKHATLKLWKANLARLQKNEERLLLDYESILNFAKRQFNEEMNRWNGRQIRNAIDTAVALAHEDVDPWEQNELIRLEAKHLNAVVESSRQFDAYLAAVHRTDEAIPAKRAGIRADQFRLRNQSHHAGSAYGNSASPADSDSRKSFGTHQDDSAAAESTGSDGDDLEVQELELQLQMAKLKRQQKALKAKRAQKSRRRDTSDDESI